MVFNISLPVGDKFADYQEIVDYVGVHNYFIQPAKATNPKLPSSEQKVTRDEFVNLVVADCPIQSVDDAMEGRLQHSRRSKSKRMITDRLFAYPVIKRAKFPLLVALTPDNSDEMAHTLLSMQIEIAFNQLSEESADFLYKKVFEYRSG